MSQPRPDTARALLDAAESLFSERGYAAVGIREIVDRANANIAAINYHFGSKSGLYVEVVRRAMERRRTAAAWRVLEPTPQERHAAAVAFYVFVHRFLDGLLMPSDDNACSLMLREAMEPSDAIDHVVRTFIVPNESLLIDLIGVLDPSSATARRPLIAESILGQILHYRVFAPFLLRTNVGAVDTPAAIERIAEHIAAFTLAGLGWSSADIAAARADADTGAVVTSTPGPPAASGERP